MSHLQVGRLYTSRDLEAELDLYNKNIGRYEHSFSFVRTVILISFVMC
jgi:hypothetical protein